MRSRHMLVQAMLIRHDGIMENQMESTVVYWGFLGIMEKKIEATIGAYQLKQPSSKAIDLWSPYISVALLQRIQ